MCFPSFKKKKIFIEVNFQSISCTKNIDVEYTGKSLKKKNRITGALKQGSPQK